MTYPVVKYPNYITPHGLYHILHGRIPQLVLTAYDGSIEFYFMGGRSIVDHINPESVRVKDIKGLVPPWQVIDQKGATQDGVTFITALYDPIQIEMVVEARGRTPERCRKVVSDLIASLDIIKTSELAFYTKQQGRWWCKVRWFDPPMDALERINTPRQRLTLVLRSDEAFWQSYDDTDIFAFDYEDMVDSFDVDYSDDQNLGPNWPQLYTDGGTGGVGFCYANGDRALWNDDPDSLFFTGTRRAVIGPYAGYSAPSDNHDVSIVINNTPEYTAGSGAANDIWARMGRNGDGSWNGYGIRARIGWGYVQISRFNNFVETVLKREFELIPPIAGETYTLKCGDGGSRTFRLLRGALEILSVTESGTGSAMGASYRGVGFGLQGGAAVITQATPARIRDFISGATTDTFGTTYTNGLGANWPIWYEGRNDAYVRSGGGEAYWVDNSGTVTQEVVNGPYKDFETATNNQVITMELGTYQEWSFPDSGANDVWGRMGRNPDGTWDGNGIRARVERHVVTLSRFNNFVETVMRVRYELFPPIPKEKITLICGYDGDERRFGILRGRLEILNYKEVGTNSLLGPNYRGVGFGMQAGAALITQATPAAVLKMSAGDNGEVTQSGFLTRSNVGDQVMFDDYTVFGPGTFRIWNGPDATGNDYVEFGRLLPNQIMWLRSDPGKQAVYDLTVVPPTPQEMTAFQQALSKFLSFAYANNIPPLIQAIVSKFGILPPQGNPYSLLKGRWSTDCGIPAKSPGRPAQNYTVKVEIVGGNADSKIIASGTPRRRYPM